MTMSTDNTSNEFQAVPGTGRTRLEEAMSHAPAMAGLWVASEAHTGVGLQEIIKDPPVTNSNGDYVFA